MRTTSAEIGEALALAGLHMGAIKIRPTNPFLWASGTFNPIYNDNRMFLWNPGFRKLIVEGFIALNDEYCEYISDDSIIAGTSTSGIPHGYGVAEAYQLPFIYVRDKAKDHGMKNQIEGNDLEGRRVLLIEDLISTGGSSVAAVAAIQKANGDCHACFSIFNYGLPNPPKMFEGEIPYNKNGDRLLSPCEMRSILYYPQLLSIGIKHGYIKKEEEEILLEWMADQANWGAKHGFPSVIK